MEGAHKKQSGQAKTRISNVISFPDKSKRAIGIKKNVVKAVQSVTAKLLL
jgi:hypothetical protein